MSISNSSGGCYEIQAWQITSNNSTLDPPPPPCPTKAMSNKHFLSDRIIVEPNQLGTRF